MSGWVPFFLLWTLAIVDGGFAGFRSAAGRNGLIFKETYYRSAIRRGLRYGIGVTLLAGLLIAVVAFTSPSPQARLDQLQPGAQAMLRVLGGYATLVLIALGIWSTAEADLRTLASVIVLGPFTLIRPAVIAGAAAWAAFVAPTAVAAGLAVAVCMLQLSVEPLLDRAIAKK